MSGITINTLGHAKALNSQWVKDSTTFILYERNTINLHYDIRGLMVVTVFWQDSSYKLESLFDFFPIFGGVSKYVLFQAA